jgi:hypothetical protein
MKRNTRGIAVMSLFVGVLAVAVYSWWNQAPERSEPNVTYADQPHLHLPSEGEPSDSTDLNRDDDQVNKSDAQELQSKPQPDLKWLREKTTNDVLVTYSQIFRHLGLTTAEKDALTDFLVEVWMSETIMANYRPEPIEEVDRQAGIAAIIGDAKLEQLLGLERNRAEYREAGHVAIFLQTNAVPLTDVQQDQLLEILTHVRGREQAAANPNVKKGTVEAIESQTTTMDEYERLVLELAPSVLTSRQMELFFDRYQALSYQRAQILETQKKTRANEDEEDDFPLGYPARH